MRKEYEGETIVVFGADVTGMTPEEVQALSNALDNPKSPEFKEMLRREIEDARARLGEMPDYTAMNAALDELDKRKVA